MSFVKEKPMNSEFCEFSDPNRALFRLVFWAKSYLKRGWATFPVLMGLNAGKKVLTFPEGGWKRNLYDLAEFKSMLKSLVSEHGGCNALGIVTGEISNLSVVDTDSPKAIQEIEGLIETKDVLQVHTRTGGRHYYFSYCPEVRTSTNGTLHVDVRNNGGFVLAPPSSFHSSSFKTVRDDPYASPQDPGDDIYRPAWTWHDIPSLSMPLKPMPPILRGFLGSGNTTKATTEVGHSNIDLNQVETMLFSIRSYHGGRLDYDTWIRVISSVWSQFSLEESLPILKRAMPPEESQEYERKYPKRLTNVSLGTLFFEARKAGWPIR